MATSNTQVTTYLPDHILEYVTKYCTEYGIVRKKDSKPILATGIVDLLNILVNIPIEDLTTAKQNISPINVESLIEKKLSDSKVISTLLDTLLDDMALVERLKSVLVPNETRGDNNDLLSTLPIKENEVIEYVGNVSKEITENILNHVRQDDIVLSSLPINNEVIEENSSYGSQLPESENKEQYEQIESRVATMVREKEDLTDKQKEVMENLNKITAGERLSYNKLADKLGVSRTVLDSFKVWQQEFTIERKKRGCDYIKK